MVSVTGKARRTTAIMAIAAGAAFAGALMYVPAAAIEWRIVQTGLPSILPAAGPPLGFTARALIAGLGIASTSNLGGAVMYTSSNPSKDLGLKISQTVGSENALRTFVRLDTGEYEGLSAYVSGQYARQDLFVDQGAYTRSTSKQINAKIMYKTDGFRLTAFADISRTNQADDAYLSKETLGRRGWDLGGYAPDWQTYLSRNACAVTTTPIKCAPSVLPEKSGTPPPACHNICGQR